MENGLHHLGIAVDNIDEVVARYRARYPRGTVIAESGDLQHGEVRIYDPECNPVTLSQKQFRPAGRRRANIPRIAHLALNALDTEAIRDFYRDVFGFRELFEAHKESRKRPGYRNKHVGDGHTNVAIQAFYSGEEGHEARFGIAHFGLLVPDSKAMAEQVQRRRRHRQGAAGAPHAVGNPHARPGGQRLRPLAARLGGRHRQMGPRRRGVNCRGLLMRFAGTRYPRRGFDLRR